jgi:hypothetical protein
MGRSNDEIRELILMDLYQVHKNARSLKSARKSMSELKRQLKQHGLSEREIVANLDFLISSGWVKVEKETTEFRSPRGFIRKQEKDYFKISDTGVNYFEGISKFQKIEKSFAGINITNIGGVTVVGDGNTVVNTRYLDLYKELSLFSEIIRKSDQLTDSSKLDYVAEIETIKSQLMKPDPDKSIIKRAWEKLKPLATVAGIASFFTQVTKLIGILI